ncbi:MAG: tRNA (adenosine(37)-N6)-threonylcarbamoyltransferase complex ATPase subunit type 1 TsaE [Fusobacteriaceae bacterium]
MKKIVSFDEINEIAKKLANYVKENTVIALIGDLGTGKTSFVKTFAKEFGVQENLKSPTFNYYLEYKSGKMPLYHFDVYRLTEAEEIYEIGYEDCLNSGGVAIIEWADIIETELPKEYIEIKFYHLDEEQRKIEISVKHNTEMEKEVLKYVGFSH